MTADRATDLMYLRHAARLALRGHGGAEPNPLVGCVVVSVGGEIVGWGCHRQCGGPHAERMALRDAGAKARGATVYLTLEPCNHTGRTRPCTELLINAKVARVVIARRDPNPVAAGGAQRLESAGIEVDLLECAEAIAVSDPFAHRVATGLPWVVAKWAQTLDGRVATRAGESQWISGDVSRRLVHRERGRVDLVLTGIGTVRSDDPLLTARGVRRRRIARRVVVDPKLEIPLTAQLVKGVREAPTHIACSQSKLESRKAVALQAKGVDLIGIETNRKGLSLEALLRELVRRHDVTHVLVEAGPGLMGRLFKEKLVNEAWVFVAPKLLGDKEALAAVEGFAVEKLEKATALTLRSVHQRGGDLVLRYRV